MLPLLASRFRLHPFDLRVRTLTFSSCSLRSSPLEALGSPPAVTVFGLPTGYSCHSPKWASFAQATRTGKAKRRAEERAGHRSSETFNLQVEEARTFQNNPTEALGPRVRSIYLLGHLLPPSFLDATLLLMTGPSSKRDASSSNSSGPVPASGRSDGNPDWVGHWRVLQYDGEAPSVPTYYRAALDSWDVIKAGQTGMHLAPHPILEVREETIVLKDEGASDEDAERWRVEVEDEQVGDEKLDDGQLRVVAETGPHAGAVGIAKRIKEDPRDLGFR